MADDLLTVTDDLLAGALAPAIIETITEPLLVLGGDLRVRVANPAFFRLFEVDSKETRGRLLYELGNGQWNIPALRKLLEEVLRTNSKISGYRVEHDFPSVGKRIMLLNANRMHFGEADDAILLAISDITDRERLRLALEGEKEFAEKLADSIRESLLVLSWDLQVRYANQSFYDCFAVTPEQTLGRFIFDLGNKQWNIPTLRRLLEEILPRGENFFNETSFDDFEVEHDFAAIGRRTMLLNARRLDHTASILLAIRDITKERLAKNFEEENAALEIKVQERVAELREAKEEMQSFAYIIGHDLRAPLINIMGFTNELQMLWAAIFKNVGQGDETAKGKGFDNEAAAAEFDEAIGFIKAATTRMDRLLSAVLAISRTGKRELKTENIDMSALVNGVVTTLAHEAQATGAKIKVGTLPAIGCDRLALEQVFSNLLDNALKYLRPEEPGCIHVTGHATSESVIYEVRDNGRGIAEADQRRVFELFRRAGPQDQRGEGVGLAYVRALLRRLGGTITLTSTLNRGPTFKVTLPRVCASQ